MIAKTLTAIWFIKVGAKTKMNSKYPKRNHDKTVLLQDQSKIITG